MRRALSSVVALTALLVTTACGAGTSPTGAPSAPRTAGTSPAPSSYVAAPSPPHRRSKGGPTPATTPAATPAGTSVTKLLVFVVENHSIDQMQAQMPFTAGLAHRYGYADHYDAITHPSLPNYLAIAGGDTFGVTDDDSPSAHPLSGPSVFGAALDHGSTARVYAEAMQQPCQSEPAGDYAVKHNPWAYFTDETAQCRRDDVPLADFDADVAHGRLPAVGMVVPDLCDDAHDCPLSQADGWLRTYVGRAMSGPDWASGRLAVVVTADEDDDAHGNRVLTVVAQPSLHHVVVSTPLDHYALSRAYADVAGVAPLRHAGASADLLRSFGLSAG